MPDAEGLQRTTVETFAGMSTSCNLSEGLADVLINANPSLAKSLIELDRMETFQKSVLLKNAGEHALMPGKIKGGALTNLESIGV